MLLTDVSLAHEKEKEGEKRILADVVSNMLFAPSLLSKSEG